MNIGGGDGTAKLAVSAHVFVGRANHAQRMAHNNQQLLDSGFEWTAMAEETVSAKNELLLTRDQSRFELRFGLLSARVNATSE